MKIKGVARFVENEYPEAKPWIGRLLTPLNESLGSMFLAMMKNLTFEDNFNCTVREVEVTHNVSTDLYHGLKSYLGVLIVGMPELDDDNYIITGYRFMRIDNSTIRIKVLFNGGGTTTGKIKLLVLGR